MNKKIIIFSTILFGLVVCSCNKTNQRNENADSASKTVSEQDIVVGTKVKNTAAQIYAKPQVPVICYHRISEGKKNEYTVTPATFEAQIKILADSGYHSISPAQLYDYLVYNKSLPEKPFMISFDDSRVEHSAIAAPILEKHGFRGVFFIMTITYNKKNYMTKDEIAQLAKAGHTVGMHSWDHTMTTKYKEITDWQNQVVEPKKKLEVIVGKPVDYWAYPYGIFDHKSAVELSKHFKLSFILSTKRDSIVPLQTVRRMIVPEWTAQGMLRSMKRTFGK